MPSTTTQWGNYRFQDHPNWFWRHSLTIVLTVLMLFQLVTACIAYYYAWLWYEVGNNSVKDWVHAAVFLYAVMTTSLVADTYGYLIQVLGKKYFFEEGSGEGEKDGDGQGEERMGLRNAKKGLPTP